MDVKEFPRKPCFFDQRAFPPLLFTFFLSVHCQRAVLAQANRREKEKRELKEKEHPNHSFPHSD